VMPPKRQKRWRVARTRGTVPVPVAETVGSVAAGPVQDTLALPGAEIRLVLEMVILNRIHRGQLSDNTDGWIAAVLANLMSVGVTTLRELVVAAPTLNQTLQDAGRRRLHLVTLTEMMVEVADMVRWPGDVPEPGSESDSS
jgi:hypothetical protein